MHMFPGVALREALRINIVFREDCPTSIWHYSLGGWVPSIRLFGRDGGKQQLRHNIALCFESKG